MEVKTKPENPNGYTHSESRESSKRRVDLGTSSLVSAKPNFHLVREAVPNHGVDQLADLQLFFLGQELGGDLGGERKIGSRFNQINQEG